LNTLFPDGYRSILWGLSEYGLTTTLADLVKTAQVAGDAAAQTVHAWLNQTVALGDLKLGPMVGLSNRARDSEGDSPIFVERKLGQSPICSVGPLAASARASGACGADYAISALAWCWTLPSLASVLSADAWWSLLNHLVRTSMEAAAGNGLSEDMPWLEHVLAGELPLSLAYLFPEIAGCRALHATARATLSAGLLDLFDGEGLPHAKQFPQLRPLLGCWTRCRVMAHRMKRACWTEGAESQYRRLVYSTMRLTRRDGSQVFSRQPAAALDRHLLTMALHVGGNATTRAVADPILAGKRASPGKGAPSGKKKGRRAAGVSVPAIHSEWAAAAVLRRTESPSPPGLTVLFPDATCQTEFACGKDVLWSGAWEFDVQIDGAPARPSEDWRETCWLSDDDVDYLELEIQLDAGLRVQRHMLLARDDRVLLLADAVLGARPAALQYRGLLPLCDGIRFRQACENREGVLLGRKRRARVLPLALPEWQPANRQHGELRQTARGLELRQAIEGRSLFAPLFLDLDRDRLSEPVTWRQLTVAESLRVQPADVAVGYRATVGKRHWLIYRALAGVAIRTVLGHNLSTELLVARFSRAGEVEPRLEIE
jgi:hypothetical protein